MVRLVYESLADYLVRKRNYDGLLLDDFTTDEMQLLSRHQIVDFDNLNVKFSFENEIWLVLKRTSIFKRFDISFSPLKPSTFILNNRPDFGQFAVG